MEAKSRKKGLRDLLTGPSEGAPGARRRRD